MGVAAGVGGQARRDKSEIGAVTRFRDMFHKFGKKFGKFRAPTRRRRRRAFAGQAEFDINGGTSR